YTARHGTVDPTGHYPAPLTPVSDTIVAESHRIADTSTVTTTLPPPTLVSIALSPADTTVEVGAAVSFIVTTTWSDGSSAPVGATYTAARGSVDATGLYTAPPAPGVDTIVASYEGRADTAAVTVLPRLLSITLSPDTAVIASDSTRQFSALGNYSDGTTETVPVSFSATGGTISTTGLYSAGPVAGTYEVVAAHQSGTADTAQVTIPKRLLSVALTPSSATVPSGGTLQFSTAGNYSDGAPDTVSVAYTATGGTIDPVTGMYAAGSTPGAYEVIATHESGKADTAGVTMTAGPPSELALISGHAQSAEVASALPLPLVVKVADAFGNPVAGATVEWQTAAGTGSLNPTSPTTDSLGNAQTIWTLGPLVGTQSATATVASLVAVQFDATAVPGAVSLTLSTLAADSSFMHADGSSQTVVRVSVQDAFGNSRAAGTDTVQLSTTSGTLGPVAHEASGMYSAILTASLTPGDAIVSAAVNGQALLANDTVILVAPVYTIEATASQSVLEPGETLQLGSVLRDSLGAPIPAEGHEIGWTSATPAIASVSPAGVVTALALGEAALIVSSEGKSDTLLMPVVPLPATLTATPTLLPAAGGQSPAPSTYGRDLSAGQTYTDPLTGVQVLKVTDALTPAANAGMDKGYSEGGPIISQPWTNPVDGRTYYTLKIGDYLVDLRYSTMALSNWRRVLVRGEIGFAFSLNPATPRIAYVVSWIGPGAKTVHRYNTATNEVENTGHWPWIVPDSVPGEYFDWLQNNVNDEWFVGMLSSNSTVVAFQPSTGTQLAFTEAATGLGIDEPHIDRELPVVYLATNNDDRQNVVGFLETSGSDVAGSIRIPDRSAIQSDDHAAPLRGMIVGLSSYEHTPNTLYYYDVVLDQTVEFAALEAVIGMADEWHTAGQWVFGNGAGPGQWFVIDAHDSDGTATATGMVREGMIAMVRPNPFSAHLIAAHDSWLPNYAGQPQPTISPDGKLVMWTSNMNGSGRMDTFLARTPTN
ncbi:MAG: invasin domain 3-containing protein, partial [Gemmatimonadales bacterium]